ncbi:MAG: hypothetical protein EOL95_09895 [Bacteroidia bacterium]|nr:hypothetical protein [Bacteroidia bacterium]
MNIPKDDNKMISEKYTNKVIGVCMEARNGCFCFIALALCLCLFSFIIIMFGGCKTIKTTLTDNSTIERKDDIKTASIDDTITANSTEEIHKTDSTNSEKQSHTGIVFGSGGGTYNLITGMATNVSHVSISEKEKQMQRLIEIYKQTEQRNQSTIIHLQDSISNLLQQNKISTTKEEKEMNWWKFLLSGVAIGAALIIFLKKFPYTKPFLFWL